ncbi:TapB family protein [Paraburkholderia ferrariae]|uniref:TapB family protein n=1 Tax=Paraburkholderia ferrariae TaxID=386056 RepID=UPI00048931D9|nr:hypothetical protein [Paraburkholderia ferrariae]
MDLSSLVAASAAIATSAASLPAPVAQPALPAQADAPVYIVGEQWTFRYTNDLEPTKNSTFAQTVSRVEGGRTEINGGSIVLDAGGNNVKTATGTFEPSDGKLQFPMSVGKTWSSSSVYRSGSWASDVERQAKVVGVEQVETPAGVFAAFKIEMTASWSGTEGNRGEGTARETDWYAPSVGRVIKMDYFDRPSHGAPTPTHVELLKFSKPQ